MAASVDLFGVGSTCVGVRVEALVFIISFAFPIAAFVMAKQSRGRWCGGEMIGLALLFLLALSGVAQSQLAEKLTQNPCSSKTKCSDCIQTKSCAWCMAPDYGDRPRCFQPSLSPFTGGCPEEWTWNPDHEQRIILKQELTRARGASIEGGGASVSGASISGSSSSQSSYRAHGEQSSGSFSSSRQSGSSSSRAGFGGAYSHGESAEFGQFSGKIVQIYPQRVGLKLRISERAIETISRTWFIHFECTI